jgi:hypothetical protein
MADHSGKHSWRWVLVRLLLQNVGKQQLQRQATTQLKWVLSVATAAGQWLCN